MQIANEASETERRDGVGRSGRTCERTNERASIAAPLASPGLPALSHPFTDYGAVAKNVRLAVTVCRQNLPFRLAFSTCENKSLLRFSYRSGEKPWEWGGRGRKGAKIRAEGGCARVGGGLAMGGGKKNRSDVGEGGKRAVREKRRRGGERKG